MDPEIIFSMKFFFSSYPKGDATKEDILKFHLRQFNLFKFRYADQATLNGEPLNDIERRDIMSRLPGTVTGEVMVYGEPDEFLFIDRMTNLFEPLRIDLPGHLAVKADSYLKFMKERKDSLKKNPEISVKGIILAYYYLWKNNIYPIPELETAKVMKPVHELIGSTHGVSSSSIKNDWRITKERDLRLSNPQAIKVAIDLLKSYFIKYDTSGAIDLAGTELNEAEFRR